MVRHMLMLQFRVDASTLQIQQVLGEFSALARLIDGIRSIGLGTNMNHESGQSGQVPLPWGVGLVWAVPAQDHYLIHLDHRALQQALVSLLADLLC